LVSEKREKNIELKNPVLVIKTNLSGAVDLHQPLRIELPCPPVKADTASIQVFLKKDSVLLLQKRKIETMPGSLRKYTVSLPLLEKSNYVLKIPAKTFCGINELENDSMEVSFVTQEESFYGNLKLKMLGVSSQTVLQFMNTKDEVLKTFSLSSDTTLIIPWLKPDKYRLKLFYDRNSNGKWDTGNYLKKLQPEKVLKYPREIQVRSNWDVETEWKL
jgi:hypothetical protein